MVKNYTYIRQAAKAVAAAARESARDVLTQYAEIKGREEEITAQLKSEITRRMAERVRDKLNGRTIHGVQFAAQVFRRVQEHDVGADLMGVLQIDTPTDSVRKVFLAQAKVCDLNINSSSRPVAICRDPRLREQARNMLDRTSDSFVFLYTPKEVFVVPAVQVSLTTRNVFNTNEVYFHTIGQFYEEHFKCFIGDEKIAPPSIAPPDLEKLSEDLRTMQTLSIQAKLPSGIDR